MTRRERIPERLKGGGDLTAAWILVAALLIVLACLSVFELDGLRLLLDRSVAALNGFHS